MGPAPPPFPRVPGAGRSLAWGCWVWAGAEEQQALTAKLGGSEFGLNLNGLLQIVTVDTSQAAASAADI